LVRKKNCPVKMIKMPLNKVGGHFHYDELIYLLPKRKSK
jgi:hypothetical protein